MKINISLNYLIIKKDIIFKLFKKLKPIQGIIKFKTIKKIVEINLTFNLIDIFSQLKYGFLLNNLIVLKLFRISLYPIMIAKGHLKIYYKIIF